MKGIIISENVLMVEALKQLSQQRAAVGNDPAAVARLHTDDVIFNNITAQPAFGKDEVQA